MILLKGKDNISSGNEEYKNKLATYSHAPMWGHSLCQDFYNSNVDFDKMNKALKSYKMSNSNHIMMCLLHQTWMSVVNYYMKYQNNLGCRLHRYT